MKFEDLQIDTAEMEESAAAELVAPYIRYAGKGKLVFLPGFDGLKDMDKIAFYLIARKGFEFLGEGKELVGINSKGLMNELRLPSYSSVRVYISRLRKLGWVLTDSKGEHFITTQAIYSLQNREKKGGTKEK